MNVFIHDAAAEIHREAHEQDAAYDADDATWNAPPYISTEKPRGQTHYAGSSTTRDQTPQWKRAR